MNEVMLRSAVRASSVPGGLAMEITGPARTEQAIRAMVAPHAEELDRMPEWTARTEPIAGGLRLTVAARTPGTPETVARIRGLGFAGLLVQGAVTARTTWPWPGKGESAAGPPSLMRAQARLGAPHTPTGGRRLSRPRRPRRPGVSSQPGSWHLPCSLRVDDDSTGHEADATSFRRRLLETPAETLLRTVTGTEEEMAALVGFAGGGGGGGGERERGRRRRRGRAPTGVRLHWREAGLTAGPPLPLRWSSGSTGAPWRTPR